MAKVFRLFPDKDLQHWEDRGEAYGPVVIEQIANPDGDFSVKEPTSIPSPFARIDLVRTSYKYVVDKNELDGNTIYHKLISDCLDVGEMFFKIESLGGNAQIKWWDKKDDLDELLESTNPKHKLLGETLDLFLKQDKEAYNFDALNRLYFILYDHQIMGGTSPSTMFFTSANDLTSTDIKFGNHVLFDPDNLVPLYKRDPEFQRYLHYFFKANPDLGKKMRDFAAYLEKNLVLLSKTDHDLFDEIKQWDSKSKKTMKQDFDSQYDALDTGTAGDNLEIIGHLLKKKKTKGTEKAIEAESDFTIKSQKYSSGYKPLVLQNSFTQKLHYTGKSVLWESTTKVPYFNNEPDLNKRILPGQLQKYPYLTISDFLQPYIIRLVYPINKDKFWDGNAKVETGDKSKSFVLPLTKMFFDFFDTTDLKKQMTDGKPMFEMAIFSGSVDVTLRIPINAQSTYITFKRTYDNRPEPDLVNNCGAIMETQFSLAVYPFIKNVNGKDTFYRVMLLDRDFGEATKHYVYDLSFARNTGNEIIKPRAKKARSNKIADNVKISTSFFVLENEFDYIEVKQNTASGIIVPFFTEVGQGSEVFTFAIDFGTTNTHIEYRIGKGNPKPFEITRDDLQWATLFSPDIRKEFSTYGSANLMYNLIAHEFLPEIISNQTEFRFPFRTALSEKSNLNMNEGTYSLADFNIPFIFEKYTKKPNARITTNLKWSNYSMNNDDRTRVERFFETLIFLIRCKVLLNNGDLDKTKLIWFYPSSMLDVKIDQLGALWTSLFNKYISKESTPVKLSESVAPFYYLENRGGISAAHLPVASIDIGGGTSDIVIYQNNEPTLLTSIRFAANSIFGDGFNGSPKSNGFVLKFQSEIDGLLKQNDQDLEQVLNEIVDEGKSEDIATFFFSLEENHSLKEKNVVISFNKILQFDTDLKIVFIVFFAAIIYHIAKIMKAKGMEPPRYLTFSGTASKILLIIDQSAKLEKIATLSNLIFEKVYEQKISKIEPKLEANPKEITCKGGLFYNADTDIDIESIKTVLLGDKEGTIVPPQKFSYVNVQDEKKLESIVEEVTSFIDLLFAIDEEFNFSKKFEVNAALMEDYKSTLKEDLMMDLKSGLSLKVKELSKNTKINVEEPLFFYPLIGGLNKLAFKIVTQYNN